MTKSEMATHMMKSRELGIGDSEPSEEQDRAEEDTLQVVTCQVDREEFALEILSVQEINRMGEIAKVPRAPHFLEGAINLRGRIVPVLNLRQRLGLPRVEYTSRSRIVVVRIEDRVLGLIVDEVRQVIRLSVHAIEPPSALGATAGAEFTKGVARAGTRLLILLDLHKLLFPNEPHPQESAQE